MTGELIPTGVTFGVGRNSINSAFSGTAYMNNVELDSGGNFSAGTGGGVIFSAGTDLYNIFVTTADGNDITRVQPGSNVTTGGTANAPTVSIVASPSLNSITASGSSSFSTVSATTIYSGGTNLEQVIKSLSGTSGNLFNAGTGLNSIISNNESGNSAIGDNSFIFSTSGGIGSSSDFSSIIGGSGHTITAMSYCAVMGGVDNLIDFIGGPPITHYSSAIIGGSGNTVASAVNSVIIGGRNLGVASNNSVVLGGDGFLPTAIGENTAYMQRTYIDEYVDLNPQSTLPTASTGRMFFSGSPLFRLMINTGNTSSDWMVIQ